MADLAVDDVTVVLVLQDRTRRRRINDVTVAFGDGSKTYPTNGVPLPTSLRGFGLSREIDRVFIQQPASGGIVYTYDPTNHTVRMWKSAAHAHDVKFIGGIAETEAVMIAGGDTLGKNAATDRTVAGADSATKGGVVAAAAAALAEFTGAVTAVILKATVKGV